MAEQGFRGDRNMAKTGMRLVTAFCFMAMIITGILFCSFDRDIYLTLAITFGTAAYHLGVRLLVGGLYNMIMKNRADYTQKWFQVRPWEKRVYQFLRVKTWKDKMPTYHPELFSIKNHTWDEIAQAMCQSELVHETNMVLSFLPLIAAKWFGAFHVFLITSICGAVFDCIFVIMQRFNRMRVMKIALKGRHCHF